MNKEIKISREWFERLLRIAEKIQKQIDNDPLAIQATNKVGVPYLMGYCSSIKTFLKLK